MTNVEQRISEAEYRIGKTITELSLLRRELQSIQAELAFLVKEGARLMAKKKRSETKRNHV